MTAGRLSLVLPLLAAVLTGCGQSVAQRTPNAAKLPLVAGTRVAVKVQRCDKGASAFCGWEMVVVAPRYASSENLVKAEHDLLKDSGWTSGNADTDNQRAADSPGHKLRVTYATDLYDLQAIDEERIKRSHKVALELSGTIFARTPAMSVLLEVGTS